MMARRIRRRLVIWAALGAAGLAAAPAQTLTLTPGGALTGPSGAVVGWGFTITNTTAQWIEITSANFCEGTSGTNTACTAATLGTFTDFISGFNDIVVGPAPDSSSVSQAFNTGTHSGTGSFQITAATGTTGAAQIVLTYNLFSRSPHDPAFNPGTDTVSTDNFLTASASVTVGGSSSNNVPVMSPAALAVFAILLAALGTRLARRAEARP
jgi:hypothetical protein